jgi:hypothetical protein
MKVLAAITHPSPMEWRSYSYNPGPSPYQPFPSFSIVVRVSLRKYAPFLSPPSARIIYTFYRQRRDVARYLASNSTVNRSRYLRVLAIGLFDILLTLPFGVAGVVQNAHGFGPGESLMLYGGWTALHADWTPLSFAYADLVADGTWSVFGLYFTHWTSPVLGLAIFALFGLTQDARATYASGGRALCSRLGLKVYGRACDGVDEMTFGVRQLGMDVESGCVPLLRFKAFW